jgi:hypothetical protein
MPRTISKLFLFNLLLIFSLSLVKADDSASQVQQIINKYGKDRIAEIILDSRGSEMTVDTDGYLHDNFGRPPKSKINARSIARDLEIMGWNHDKLRNRLEQDVAADKKALEDARQAEAAKKQSSADKNKTAVIDSSDPDAYDHYCMKGCQTSTLACIDSGIATDTCTNYHDKCMFQCIQYYQLQ